MMKRLLRTHAPRAVLLIRLMIALVFVSEGVQKFLFPQQLGAGRFAAIGIPFPGATGPFVGAVEVVCGGLVLLGLATRLASVALLIDISVAILSTKVPILLGHGYATFSLPAVKSYGWLSMLHEARTDFSMWLGLLFLLIVGAGTWSIDAALTRRSAAR